MIVERRPESRAGPLPDEEGYVERDGVRVFYEVYGDAPTTFLLFPPSPISHSRMWKGRDPVPLAATSARSSSIPAATAAPTGPRTQRRTPGGSSSPTGGRCSRARAQGGARRRPLRRRGAGRSCSPRPIRRRILGVAAIAPFVPRLTPSHPNYTLFPSDVPLGTDEGWAKCNVHYWRRDYQGFLEFFFSQIPEPHSTKQIEDCVRWGLEGGAE